MKHGPVATAMKAKLAAAFEPTALELIDESERHRGHGGWREGGETHFVLHLVSEKFAGLNRLNRQRAVHHCLAEEMAEQVHALSLRLETPEEAAAQ
ncbi:MAG: BolA family transcriptional regulator [Neomegalonema sp.]|nr:BolA family transcriptional regulator [Neomegalonema sp.]